MIHDHSQMTPIYELIAKAFAAENTQGLQASSNRRWA
jgi:hypothetical protein